MTKTTRAFLDALSDALGVELDPDDIEGTVARLGSIARIIGATLRNTANPTMLEAGYKCNVIPGWRARRSTAGSCRARRRSTSASSTRSSAPTSSASG